MPEYISQVKTKGAKVIEKCKHSLQRSTPHSISMLMGSYHFWPGPPTPPISRLRDSFTDESWELISQVQNGSELAPARQQEINIEIGARGSRYTEQRSRMETHTLSCRRRYFREISLPGVPFFTCEINSGNCLNDLPVNETRTRTSRCPSVA